MAGIAEILNFDAALELLLLHAGGLRGQGAEELDLLASRGRVLAEDVLADRDQPPFDRATRDGFAVNAADLTSGAAVQVTGQVRAGECWSGPPPGSGSAIEIMTGAPVPAGADAVVMIEHIERLGDSLRLEAGRSVRAGDHIVPGGSEARAGQTVLRADTNLGAAEIALAASCGRSRVSVFRKPRVAIIATGDELVELNEMPEPQQIRNSNSYALAALVEAAGGEAVRLPIARDTSEAIHAAIERGREHDLLVLSGGVSMGKYDLVEEVLTSLGAEFFFTGVRMQPGKPVVFGRLPNKDHFPASFFFGLPGNPVSTQVTFHVFVEPMVRALAGAGAQPPQFVQATLAQDLPGKPDLTRLLPARLTGIEVRLVGWQGSGDLAANARANCYALLRPSAESLRAGQIIRVLLR